MRKLRPLKNRFLGGFDENPDTGCWEWIGKLNHSGYGLITRGAGDYREQRAHRVAYELFVGPIPVGLVVHHICHNPKCVNPTHLELNNRLVNLMRDGNASKATCKRGHPFTVENTYVKPSTGYRNCRTCHRLYEKRRRDRAEEGLPSRGTAAEF